MQALEMIRDELKTFFYSSPTEPQPNPNLTQPSPTTWAPGRLTQARASAMLRLEGGLRLVTDVQAGTEGQKCDKALLR